MPQLLPFFVILLVALFFSELFSRLHLPLVIALILGGILIGPYALDLFAIDETVELLGQIGLIFLMFMAGLETRLSTLRRLKGDVAKMVVLNGLLPFAIGVGIGLYLGEGMSAALLLGTIFISSSIAVVIPSLEANKLMETRLGRSIVASTVVEDVASLLILSVLLQTTRPVTPLPLPAFYLLLFLSFFVLRWLLPKLRIWFFKLAGEKTSLFEWELQMLFVILLGTVVFFELLGLHAIIAGFFAGLVLAESIKSDILKGKLRAISYGFFIPVFFVVTGAQTNISVFYQVSGALTLTAVIVGGSLIAKFSGGWLGGKWIGFTNRQSVLIGGATIPQLSTTLAVVITGFQFGILREELVTAMVMLSIITTLVGPLIVRAAKGSVKTELPGEENNAQSVYANS